MADPKVKRVLMSVTDKTGVVEFARALSEEFGAQIISTGGTARVIAEAGIPVTPIDEVTQFPEMMDGRVKTLHPAVHGGLLAKRDNPEHMAQAAEHGIEMIDMVVLSHEHLDHIGAAWHFHGRAYIAAHRLAANKIMLRDDFSMLRKMFNEPNVPIDIDIWLEPWTEGIFFSSCSNRAWSMGTSV